MSCRTGCREGGHRSYGECLRSARVSVGPSDTNSKVIMSELSAYVDARVQGVQPASTSREATDFAMASSEATGVAFRAEVDA